jgi:hypothetical protein
MPISPADAERYAEEIRQIYQEAEHRLLAVVAKRLKRGLNVIDDPGWAERQLAEIRYLNRDIQAASKLITGYDEQIEAAIQAAYDQGQLAAAKDLVAAKLTAPVTDTSLTGANTVRTLAGKATGTIKSTQLRILRTAQDAYRQVVYQVSAVQSTGTLTRRQACQIALNRFADKGITGFIDTKGRSRNLASYCEMAVRSSVGQAAIEGHHSKLEDAGQDLVMVSSNNEGCDICEPWQGRILSLKGKTPGYPTVEQARDEGLFHPNCTHTTGLYVKGLTKPVKWADDPEGNAERYKQRQRQRYNERQIRKFKGREAVAITDEAKAKAAAKVKEWQKVQRDYMDETGRRRDYSREQVRTGKVGVEMPFGGPA